MVLRYVINRIRYGVVVGVEVSVEDRFLLRFSIKFVFGCVFVVRFWISDLVFLGFRGFICKVRGSDI